MPFPRRFLHDDEEVVLDRKPHLLYMAQPFFATVGALVAAIVLAQLLNPGNGRFNGWISWFGVALVLVGVAWFVLRYLKWVTTNFVVTTDRLVYRAGLIAKEGKEIPLERINDISFKQSVFERIMGAGDLLIESGGEQGQQRFHDIRRPFEVQNEIYRQMERTQARDMDRMAGRRQISIPEQIEKLDELRQRGVLSQAEFDAKKAQLLDQL